MPWTQNHSQSMQCYMRLCDLRRKCFAACTDNVLVVAIASPNWTLLVTCRLASHNVVGCVKSSKANGKISNNNNDNINKSNFTHGNGNGSSNNGSNSDKKMAQNKRVLGVYSAPKSAWKHRQSTRHIMLMQTLSHDAWWQCNRRIKTIQERTYISR